MKTVKIFIILLISLLAVSLIFNKPGVSNLEIFHNYFSRTPPHKDVASLVQYPLLMQLTMGTILKSFPLDVTIPLFSNQKAWPAGKFLIFSFYFLTWLSLLYLRRSNKKIFKISALNLSFLYFLSAPILLSSVALSFFEIIAVPFLILALSLLLQKNYFFFFMFYLLSVLLNSILIFFLPIILTYILGPKKIVFYLTIPLVGLVTLILENFLPTQISSRFISYLWFLIPQTIYILAFVLISIFYVQKLTLEKKLDSTNLINSSFLLFLVVTAFLPNLPPGNLIWLPVLGLISYMALPSKKNRLQLFAINLLVFINFFIFFGTAGIPPIAGNFFEISKFILGFFYLIFVLKSTQKMKNFTWLKKFLIAYLIVINFSLLTSQGSPDMVSWGQYAKAAIDFPNPFMAQTVIDQRYPPISTVIIGVFANLWNRLVGLPPAPAGYDNVPHEYAFTTKISVLVFYFISAWLMFKFRKPSLNKLLTVLSTFSLIVQTQGFADVNIHAIPFLIIAITLLFKNKPLPSGLFAGIAISIKWQPIILIPVFLLTIPIKKVAKFILGLVIVPIVSWYLVFIQPGGAEAFERSFSYLRQGAPMLSGQALNLNWVVTYALHVIRPLENYSLEHLEGLNRQIPTVNAPFIFQGSLFLIATGLIFLHYWTRQKKSLGNFLAASLMIFFSHQILNKSAYEKHLFYSVIFMLLLFLVRPIRINKLLLILFDVMTLLNLGFFYGFTGPKDINRLFLGFDMTVAFSIFYTIIYFWLLKKYFSGELLWQQRQKFHSSWIAKLLSRK